MAFSVAWGIFMLMIQPKFGTGLRHGAGYDFSEGAVNTLRTFPGSTSKPYRGMKPGRNISLKNEDLTYLKERVNGAEHITGRFYCYGEIIVRHKEKYSSFEMTGIMSETSYTENQTMLMGR